MESDTTRPMPGPTLAALATAVTDFAARWHGYPNSELPSVDPDVANLVALDAVQYEGNHSTFFESRQAFQATAAAAVGNCLHSKLGFEWCEVLLSSGPVAGMRHGFARQVVPLEAAVVHKLSQSQDDTLVDLVVDIYLASTFPERTHFADELREDIEEDEYEARWGFRVPPAIHARVLRLLDYDRERAIRGIGIAAFDWSGQPDWDRFSQALSGAERWFYALYHEPFFR
jgi:hypothetical protein